MLELKPRNIDRKAYKDMLLQHSILRFLQSGRSEHYRTLEGNMTTLQLMWQRMMRTLFQLVTGVSEQPPNSPDFNILGLRLFAGIKSLQYQAAPRNVEELIEAMKKAYKEYETQLVDDNFLTLMKCMEVCDGC